MILCIFGSNVSGHPILFLFTLQEEKQTEFQQILTQNLQFVTPKIPVALPPNDPPHSSVRLQTGHPKLGS